MLFELKKRKYNLTDALNNQDSRKKKILKVQQNDLNKLTREKNAIEKAVNELEKQNQLQVETLAELKLAL